MRCPNCRVIEVGEWRFSNGQCTQNRTNENQAQFLVEAVKACIFILFSYFCFLLVELVSCGIRSLDLLS